MESKKIQCPKCGSDNYTIQREQSKVKQKKGCLYFLIMNVLFGIFYWTYIFIKWMFLFIIWLLILVPIRLIQKKPLKMPQISYRTMVVCQNCGHSWKIANK